MEIRAGFEPAINRFAVCPLEPLEYRIMAGIAGLEPTGLSQRPVPWPLGYIPIWRRIFQALCYRATRLLVQHARVTNCLRRLAAGDPRRARTEHYSLERAHI